MAAEKVFFSVGSERGGYKMLCFVSTFVGSLPLLGIMRAIPLFYFAAVSRRVVTHRFDYEEEGPLL